MEPASGKPEVNDALPQLKRSLAALTAAREKLARAERARTEPIAIVGMGCRMPGGRNPEEFWRLLRDGRDAITVVPRDRWDLDEYFDADPAAPGKMYTRWGAFLPDIDRFDAAFFGISPREARAMDPQQRLLLEVAWEALESGGYAPDALSGSPVGVFVGISTADYGDLASRSNSPVDAYSGTGGANSLAAGRLSYHLGLRGPCFAVDTACSSSLVALHQACMSLRAGECSMALVAGVNVILVPEGTVYFSKVRAMSPTGRCRTFDAGADGYVRGEGCGVVALKLLSHALRDRDHVLACVRSSAVNHDGRSNGLTAPNGMAQREVIRRALEFASIDPLSIGYVEAHGTGTALGDPIEVEALASELCKNRPAAHPLAIGSVKTNVGHLEAAAGMSGLIKLILMLERREIPPHLHFSTPSPHIPWNEWPIEVPVRTRRWAEGESPRRGGLSSFGFAGTNAHIILEEAPALLREEAPPGRETLVLSARDAAALKDLGQKFAEFLADTPYSLTDVAYTAGVGRSQFACRLAVEADSKAEARERLLEAISSGEHFVGKYAGEYVVNPYARRVPVPTYPFQRQRYWGEFGARPQIGANPKARHAQRPHRILGNLLRSPLAEIQYELPIGAESHPILADHRLFDRIVVPGAFHLTLLFAAADELEPGHPFLLENISFHEAIVLDQCESRPVQLILTPAEAGRYAARIMGFRENWTLHASATLQLGSVEAVTEDWATLELPEIPVSYDQIWGGAIFLGPAFRWISRLRAAGKESRAELRPPEDDDYLFHAGVIDCCLFHGIGPLLPASELPWVPVAISSIRISGRPRSAIRCYSQVLHLADDSVTALVRLSDESGEFRAVIEGLQLRRVSDANLIRTGDPLYTLQWRETPAQGAGNQPRDFVIYPDKHGVSRVLIDMLRQRGHVVSTNAPASGIVWFAETDEPCRELLEIAQRTPELSHTKILIVTRGAERDPVQGAVWGLGRAMIVEQTAQTCSLLDLDPEMSNPAAAEAILAELSAEHPEAPAVIRGGRRCALRLVPAAPSGAVPPAKFHEDSAYLITGGAGALGRELAHWMVARGAKHIFLAGRTKPAVDLPFHFIPCDVSSQEDIASMLASIPERLPLRGVIHLAGVLDDGVLSRLTWPRFSGVLAPKAQGAWNVHRATLNHPLDFFVMFSSLASLVGSPGQGSYAAANASLDALAHHRRALGLKGTSINWGPWAGDTMASRRGHSHRMLNFEPIAPEQGFRIVERILAADYVQAAVIQMNVTALSRGSAGEVPAILTEVLPAAAATGKLAARLEAAPAEHRPEILQAFIGEQALELLGAARGTRFNRRQSLLEMGMDSLMATDLRNRLQAALGAPVSPTIVFDYPTGEAIGNHLADNLPSLFPKRNQNTKHTVEEPDRTLLETIRSLTEEELLRSIAGELAAIQAEG